MTEDLPRIWSLSLLWKVPLVTLNYTTPIVCIIISFLTIISVFLLGFKLNKSGIQQWERYGGRKRCVETSEGQRRKLDKDKRIAGRLEFGLCW